VAAPARAQPDVIDDSVYRTSWLADGLVVGLAAAVWAAPFPFEDQLVKTGCTCARSDVPGFDRTALGHSSHAAQVGSDYAIAGLLVLAPALDLIDVRLHGQSWVSFGRDVVVIGEAVLVSGALDEVVKLAVHRPRPLAYSAAPGSDVARQPDTYLSFYSSHTSNAFAAGMAYASTFALRHPDSSARYAVYGAVVAAGAGIGTMRVLAGKHFPSDVVTGAVVGSAIGLTVPALHRRRDLRLTVGPGNIVLTGSF
jgi:membrane-associated phospholipid phosphatase